MDEQELALRRTQMGRAAVRMAVGQSGEWLIEPGRWMMLTGVPAADSNMAVIQSADPAALASTLERVAARRLPVVLMFAGDGLGQASALPTGWVDAGFAPVMAVDLTATPFRPDPRVRRAGPQDVVAVRQLIMDAYSMTEEIAGSVLEFVREVDDPVLRLWVLESGGEPVSTLISGRVEDTVSIWCVATPPQFQRRGYARALSSAVLAWATADGARIGLLGATEGGLPLYEATGWHTIENWHVFVNADSAQFH